MVNRGSTTMSVRSAFVRSATIFVPSDQDENSTGSLSSRRLPSVSLFFIHLKLLPSCAWTLGYTPLSVPVLGAAAVS